MSLTRISAQTVKLWASEQVPTPPKNCPKKNKKKTERSEKFNWLFAGSFSSCYPHNQITPQPSDLASWYIESLNAISTQIYHQPSPPTLLAGKLILLSWKRASTPASVYWIREIMKSLLVVQIRHLERILSIDLPLCAYIDPLMKCLGYLTLRWNVEHAIVIKYHESTAFRYENTVQISGNQHGFLLVHLAREQRAIRTETLNSRTSPLTSGGYHRAL